MDIDQRLQELGITLPKPAAAAGNYLPTMKTGNLLFISGQLPFDETGELTIKGRIGDELTLEDGVSAARYCLINILAQASAALGGDLNRIEQCLKLSGYVASTKEFTDQPKVLNGASDLIVEILGDTGKHTRIAVGVASLPLGAAVEIDAQFSLKP